MKLYKSKFNLIISLIFGNNGLFFGKIFGPPFGRTFNLSNICVFRVFGKG